MLLNIGKATVMAAIGMAFWGGIAYGQTINPQCQTMRDKQGCTCALETGGSISADGKRWNYFKRRTVQYAACMAEKFKR